jgi:nucleoid DNA-binding protein
MDKSQLIENIAKHFGIQDSEQKLFFEIFLRKCSEALDTGQFIQVAEIGEVGKFEDRNAANKEARFKIAVIVNQDEFLFDIPGEDKEVQSIDSYFSISIGKPVIPLKESDDSEFFIPHSGNEMKRMFELKVERFIEDTKKQQNELEEESELDFSDNLSDVNFSFKNWKSSTDEDNELPEEKIDEEQKAETDFTEDQDTGEQTISDISEETSEEISEETGAQLEEITPGIEEIPHGVEEITEEIKIQELIEDEKIEEEVKPGVEETESSEIVEKELSDEKVEETEKGLEDSDEIFSEEKYTSTESVSTSEEENTDDKQMVMDAVKKAEEKDARLEKYTKKSYGGFIFAIAALVIIVVVIYFYSYSVNPEQSAVQQNNAPKQFAVTIDRTYDIPVTYPYTKGMLGEPYNAINVGVLSRSGKEVIAPAANNNETVLPGGNNSGKIEIREPLPARRVEGYIYKYENMYAVQVSSWKSKSIALSEGQKYLDAGNDAFIEQTELNDKGTYYRVRVGGFSTLEEAENFLKK